MATTPEAGLASLIKNLEAATGKTIEVWVETARASGLTKHKQLMDHLKAEHGLTHGYANQVALRALAADDAPAAGSDDLVTAQYAGSKATLRPIYDALCVVIGAFGDDVDFSPKKAYVSLRRNKQFGLIQPSTPQRVDVGIILKDLPAEGRLEVSGSFNAMVTHRVRVTSVDEIDTELVGWLRQAYAAA